MKQHKTLLLLFLLGLGSFPLSAKDTKSKEKISKGSGAALEDLELFNKVLFLIEKEYYREVDSKKLIKGAIKGMIDSLDPHSSYLHEELFKKMREDTQGEFGGVGIEPIQKNGHIYVLSPGHKTPASKAKINAGDRIIEVDHRPIYGMNLGEVRKLVQGPTGTKIHLAIKREGEKKILHFSLTREKIQISPVEFKLIRSKYAYIKLIHFQKRSAKEVRAALKKMQKQTKLRGIILDLRGNPGGLLEEAVQVASIFLSEGVVVSTEARNKSNKDVHRVKNSGLKDTTTPLAILQDGSSASASEIVAGALQDHRRGLVMGKTSFGKGSVQTVVEIDDKNGMKLTIAQYMTPSGKKIQALGIRPDITLEKVNQEDWVQVVKDDTFIRESDLRNHLTATLESAEEKQARLERIRAKRASRMHAIERKNMKKSEKLLELQKPENDFQVLQAISYLKTYDVLRADSSQGDAKLNP